MYHDTDNIPFVTLETIRAVLRDSQPDLIENLAENALYAWGADALSLDSDTVNLLLNDLLSEVFAKVNPHGEEGMIITRNDGEDLYHITRTLDYIDSYLYATPHM